MHLNDQSTLDTDYWGMFESIMSDSLCGSQTYFTTAALCGNFSSGILQQGLHVVMVNYFSGLRTTLNNYQTYLKANNQTLIKAIFNS